MMRDVEIFATRYLRRAAKVNYLVPVVFLLGGFLNGVAQFQTVMQCGVKCTDCLLIFSISRLISHNNLFLVHYIITRDSLDRNGKMSPRGTLSPVPMIPSTLGKTTVPAIPCSCSADELWIECTKHYFR